MPLLSLAIWTPIAGAVLVWLLAGDRRPARARTLALLISLLEFAITVPLYTGFDASSGGLQFVERLPWVESFAIYYHLGIDGIALPFILLTSFVTVLVVAMARVSVDKQLSQYLGAFLVMEGLMIGLFCAVDAMLFYVFWEAMLIPMFIIIGIWGGPNRVYATLKFFLYTFLGSVLLLVALIYLHLKTGSFSLLDFQRVGLDLPTQKLLFLAFLAAFAVKIPMWPVHTWLPDAHVEAPTGGSVVLAAIMLKMGGYGFLRLSLPIAPDASMALSGLLIALSLIAIVYIGAVALVQQDMKKLIAYSSISHMGFVTLGTFLFTVQGIEGGIVQMVSHGFISAAMFLCVGVMYDRVHSRQIADYGGVANSMPVFAAFMMLFAMANSGLPGTSGFVGEFMVILAAFPKGFWIALLAGTSLVLGAAYNLWMYKRVIFGAVANAKVAALQDLKTEEFVVLGLLAVAVLAMGVWPNPLVDVTHASVDALLAHLQRGKLGL
ncbi:MAG: NADH-quinone oxidoreductase subunit M [Immundisolibacter sp.]|nr:NADH-quinone oxidoreductase subunit M [Immundisolibacter sp.]MDD3650163.1 NADH-quinone oxidoreductase subunit M [Immundisolibacter sp.]